MSSPLLDSLLSAPPPAAAAPWLAGLRADALAALRADGLPTQRVEAWKYTPLRPLEARRYASADAEAATRAIDAAAFALPGVDGPRLVFVNGVFRAELSDLSALPAGVHLQPLSRALAEDPEPLRDLLERRYGGGDAFARLNTALAHEGLLLRVAPGAHVAPPLHLVQIGAPAAGDVAWQLRHLLDLGAGASVSLVEHHLAAGDHAHLGNTVLQARVGSGAQLRLVQIQDAAAGASLIRRSEIDVGAGAAVELATLEFGGGLVRHDLAVALSGAGARCASRGAFVLRGRQHVDTRLDVRHLARDTACDLVWRGVADGRARGIFHGGITIAAGADGAAAHLTNKNLLLSPHAEIDTQPVLEIHADEVQASHGATVGQIDETALFYLRSRGLPQALARAMLIHAFCHEAIERVAPDALRDHLDAALLAHLPQRPDA